MELLQNGNLVLLSSELPVARLLSGWVLPLLNHETLLLNQAEQIQ
jgi:hypothetical protein